MSLITNLLSQQRAVMNRINGNSTVFASRDAMLGGGGGGNTFNAPKINGLQQDTFSFGGRNTGEMGVASGHFQAKYSRAHEEYSGKKIDELFKKGLSGFDTFG